MKRTHRVTVPQQCAAALRHLLPLLLNQTAEVAA